MNRHTEPAWVWQARQQHGVISRPQLLLDDVTDSELLTLVGKGILVPQADGVYQFAGAPASFDSALWVAVLATYGTLGSTTAAWLWGMLAGHDGPIHITIPRGARIDAPPGVRLLRRSLGPDDQQLHRGLRVVRRHLAAIDHLVGLPLTAATSFTDRALQQGWLTRQQLADRLRNPMRGNSKLRQVLATIMPGAEAESERLLHRLLQKSGLTGWVGNHPVSTGDVVLRIDVAFVVHRVAIEIDGFAYHSRDDRFQQDRRRQNRLTLLGWTVLRFTWADLTERPRYVVATIANALRVAESGGIYGSGR